MNTLLILTTGALLLVGFIFTLSNLPGTVVIFITSAMFAILTRFEKVTLAVLLLLLGLSFLPTFLDSLLGFLGRKTLTPSIFGVIGGFVGGLLGLTVAGLSGLIIGPVIGTIVGETVCGKNINLSLKASLLVFIEIILRIVFKVFIAALMIAIFLNSAF